MTSSFSTGFLRVNRQLENATQGSGKASNRLSSGKRINYASDDAAGLAIAKQLLNEAAVRTVGSDNVGYAQSVNAVVSSAIEAVTGISLRLSELAAQAANGTYSAEQRDALQNEYSQLQQEAVRISETTEFNGQKLLTDGSSTSYQVGPDGSSSSTIQSGGSGISSILAGLPSNISSQSAAQSALDGLQATQSKLSQQQGQIGATSSRLEYANNVNKATSDNLRAAASRIEDADIAKETADLAKYDTQKNAALYVSAQLKESEKSKYSTLLSKIKA
jgi:flagellin